jgi:hypothetical protein
MQLGIAAPTSRIRMEIITIPLVRSLVHREGCFDLADHRNRIILLTGDDRINRIIPALNDEIAAVTGCSLPVERSDLTGSRFIRISVSSPGASDESYAISIMPDIVTIKGAGEAGAFYGIQTLRQIIRTNGLKVPCCKIDDSPDFANRGFYHDVTRGKVPALATLKSLVDTCAFYKINQLQLYVEHSFAFRALPDLWRDKDPLTAGDIRELDNYCRMNFIDLVPSMATFGHLYELLRLKRFEHLNELDIKASALPHNLWDRMAHYTIDVSQKESFDLIKSMLDEYLPLFSSRFANICCDETFDLGKGKNRDIARIQGTGRLYSGFVKKLIAVAASHGKTPMLWGDMVLRYPEFLKEFSSDTVFLNWDYGPQVTPDATAAFAHAGVIQYVCPGVSGWSRFASDINAASLNIRKMVGYGRNFNALGVLNTDWGDCGHVNFLANSWHGMALGAALSWNAHSYGGNGLFDKAFSHIQFHDSTGEITALLRDLGSLCFYHFGNLYAWVYDLKCLWNREQEVRQYDAAELHKRYDRACAIKDRYIALGGSDVFSCHEQDLAEFTWSAEAVQWMLALLLFKKDKEFGQKTGKSTFDGQSLVTQGETLVRDFERLWLRRNRESELRNVVSTFNKAFLKIAVIPEP